jgi:hypothetical protein
MVMALCPAPQASAADRHGIPAAGAVPDARAAVAIAKAILTPIYGEELRGEESFHATLKGGLWTVQGTLNCGGQSCKGGVAEIEIAKSDGRVILISHGK